LDRPNAAKERLVTSRVEWNAERYHQVSTPHQAWAAGVLDRVPREGISVAIDAGCGTGKITRELLERLPNAVVYAVDVSPSMLAVAERELTPVYGDRVRFAQADLAHLTPASIGTTADLIFSTATFHWVTDHDLLFGRLFDLLRPGGHLIAQCGGGPNLRAMLDRVDVLMRSGQFARYYADWADPWLFASAEETARQLNAAGFGDVETDIESHPARMANADEYRSFISTVILRDQLSRLPTEQLKGAFVEQLTQQAAVDHVPFELDYWRLNMNATRAPSFDAKGSPAARVHSDPAVR
jgi:trans-aconitate 2-methyltransferase